MNLSDLKKNIPFKWRVQSVNEYAAVCVAYIDSRDVQEILDSVVGPEKWQSDYKDVKGNLFAGIGIHTESGWVWKWDCGIESKTEAEKGEASDSFKRAAVKWGIGRFLYDLGIKRLKVTEYKNKKYPLNEVTGKAIFDGEELTNYISSLKNGNTAHNHKKLDTPGKPLISNADFKKICGEIKEGNFSNLEKVKENFSFEKTQQELINQLYKNAKKVTA